MTLIAKIAKFSMIVQLKVYNIYTTWWYTRQEYVDFISASYYEIHILFHISISYQLADMKSIISFIELHGLVLLP